MKQDTLPWKDRTSNGMEDKRRSERDKGEKRRYVRN